MQHSNGTAGNVSQGAMPVYESGNADKLTSYYV